MRNDIDINCQCNQKYTPFLLAVRLGNQTVIQIFLEKFFPVKPKNEVGVLLVNHKMDLDIKGGFG